MLWAVSWCRSGRWAWREATPGGVGVRNRGRRAAHPTAEAHCWLVYITCPPPTTTTTTHAHMKRSDLTDGSVIHTLLEGQILAASRSGGALRLRPSAPGAPVAADEEPNIPACKSYVHVIDQARAFCVRFYFFWGGETGANRLGGAGRTTP